MEGVAGNTIAQVRLATKEDVPHILKLIQQLAEFELSLDKCTATESALHSTLFNGEPPFQGPTVFILEISTQNPTTPLNPNPNPNPPLNPTEPYHPFEPISKAVTLEGVVDPDVKTFECHNGKVVVGFVLFFRNYSTWLAKPGFYVEDLYVRAPYRRMGLGSILLKAVARQANKMDYGRVEWCVLDWNVNAIKFYEEIGAQVLQEWRICRLTGDALQSFKE